MSPEELRKAGMPLLAKNQAEYIMAWDEGGPGGDKTVSAVYDTVKREIVSVREWAEGDQVRMQRAVNAILNAEVGDIADRLFGVGLKTSGVDDQGEAIVIETIPKGKG